MANVSLKSQMDADADACGLPRKALADVIGMSTGCLYAALDEGQPTQQLSLAKFVRFLHVTGGKQTLGYLASLCGCVVYALPQGTHGLDANAAESIREFGEMLTAFVDANADGRIDEREAERFTREARQVIAAVATFMQAVEARTRPATLQAVR